MGWLHLPGNPRLINSLGCPTGKTNEADRLAKADARKRYTHVETIFRVYLVAMRFAFFALTHSVVWPEAQGRDQKRQSQCSSARRKQSPKKKRTLGRS